MGTGYAPKLPRADTPTMPDVSIKGWDAPLQLLTIGYSGIGPLQTGTGHWLRAGYRLQQDRPPPPHRLNVGCLHVILSLTILSSGSLMLT